MLHPNRSVRQLTGGRRNQRREGSGPSPAAVGSLPEPNTDQIECLAMPTMQTYSRRARIQLRLAE